jgi:predicted transcriptional regulator
MKYRSRTDIVGSILEATSGGRATKTKIMYKAFLSFAQLKEYLRDLLQNDLIEFDEGHKTYATTAKGIQLLQIFNNMQELNPIRLNEIEENSILV